MFNDSNGKPLNGANGIYTVTTTNPPVKAFWSVIVYDTVRGVGLHPNKNNRYHINNTSAVKNSGGTITFVFKTNCDSKDVNCLEVPKGPFDVTMRYYLHKESIRTGKWTLPGIQLKKQNINKGLYQ